MSPSSTAHDVVESVRARALRIEAAALWPVRPAKPGRAGPGAAMAAARSVTSVQIRRSRPYAGWNVERVEAAFEAHQEADGAAGDLGDDIGRPAARASSSMSPARRVHRSGALVRAG